MRHKEYMSIDSLSMGRKGRVENLNSYNQNIKYMREHSLAPSHTHFLHRQVPWNYLYRANLGNNHIQCVILWKN